MYKPRAHKRQFTVLFDTKINKQINKTAIILTLISETTLLHSLPSLNESGHL